MKEKTFEKFFAVWVTFCILLVVAACIVAGHFIHKYW